MKKLTTILLILTALFVSSCMTEKRINRLRTIICHDYVQTIVKDSLIKIPIYYEDSAYMALFLACDSNGQIYQLEKTTLQGKISTLESRLSDNKVIVHSRTLIHDTVTKTVTNTITKEGVTIYKDKPLKGYYRFVSWGFWILLVLIIIYVVWRILGAKIKINLTGI